MVVLSSFCLTGLTPDENHISPIENLDNTISRLYSYLSGSEGEGETEEGASPQQRVRRGHHPHHRPHHRRHHPARPTQHHGAGDQWERRRSRTPPSCEESSRSSSCSQSDSELVNHHHHHDSNLDTLRSSGTGENVYSRINDTGAFPSAVLRLFLKSRVNHRRSLLWCQFSFGVFASSGVTCSARLQWMKRDAKVAFHLDGGSFSCVGVWINNLARLLDCLVWTKGVNACTKTARHNSGSCHPSTTAILTFSSHRNRFSRCDFSADSNSTTQPL